MDLKQVIVIPRDLPWKKGKIASQVAHAAVKAVMNTPIIIYKEWDAAGHKKVVLEVQTQDDLLDLTSKVMEEPNIPFALIKDMGLTQIPPDSWTALAIGPWHADEIDKLTGHLKLFN